MASESRSLFSLARSKLHLSVGERRDPSLHRWVLLKNSIIRSHPSSPSASTERVATDVVNAVPPERDGPEDEEVGLDEEVDSFMFPDASMVVDRDHASPPSSHPEAQWFDSLLETLGDEDDDDLPGGVDVSVEAVDEDDDDSLLSPSVSPISSSEDLVTQPAYYPPAIAIPYPVPYPPYQPHMRTPFDLDCVVAATASPIDPASDLYADALPYLYDVDDLDNLSVPDAIEDTSDDESDLPSTPSLSFRRSSTGFGGIIEVDPASIPLPEERRPRRPHVYIDSDDSHFYPFELDPLPFPDEDHRNAYNPLYQEC